jgi:uncharacterized membrane protein SpoIIM required for sporulation
MLAMNVDEFVRARQATWQRLSDMLDGLQHGRLSQLSISELEELGRLYRAATSDLAIARRDYPDHRVAIYLNQLVGRAHHRVYRGEALELRRVARFFLGGLPRLFRQTGRYTALAAALFLGAAAIGYAAVYINPDLADQLLPAQMQALIPLIKRGEMWTDIPAQMRSIASSFIMTNNIQVAFMAFAGGVLFGLLTGYVLLFNGLTLGVIGALCQRYGLALPLWSFVLPHGVIELSVIFIAGGSGLMLGHALLSPGLHRRRDALAQAAQKGVRLIIGSVPLLVIAGTIEGFISPSGLHPWGKIGIGLLTGAGLYGYLLLAGRKVDRL